MSGLYDQTPGEPYGSCMDCAEVFATREEASAHGSATMKATGERGVVARGHSYRVTNPTRAERIRNEIRFIIDGAADKLIEEVLYRASRMVESDGIGAAEIREVLASESVDVDFSGVWDEYVEENADDLDFDAPPPTPLPHTTLDGI